MNMIIEPSVAGRYKLQAIKVDTGESRDLTDWFDNLITDIGLDRMGTGSAVDYCLVGSGSTAPAFTDTSLASFVASTSMINASTYGAAASAPYYGWSRMTFRFAQGVATGNLSEVGVGWSATNSSLFSRSLIKDAGGNPTTVTVLSDEVLDVIYEFRLYAPASDVSSTFDLSGTTYSYNLRPAYVTSGMPYWYAGNPIHAGGGIRVVNTTYIYPMAFGAGGSLGVATAGPNGVNNGNFFSGNSNAYSSGSHSRSGSITAGLNDCNSASGITALLIHTDIGAYQIEFPTPIPKDATKVFTLNYQVSWARA